MIDFIKRIFYIAAHIISISLVIMYFIGKIEFIQYMALQSSAFIVILMYKVDKLEKKND